MLLDYNYIFFFYIIKNEVEIGELVIFEVNLVYSEW